MFHVLVISLVKHPWNKIKSDFGCPKKRKDGMPKKHDPKKRDRDDSREKTIASRSKPHPSIHSYTCTFSSRLYDLFLHESSLWLNISCIELYQLLQYSYICSSVMSVHPEGGGSVRDTRVSLTSVDMVSRLAKSCWMSTIPTVCRGSRQVVTALSELE